MKKFYFLIVLSLLILRSYSQYCSYDNRFTEKSVFTNEQINSNFGIIYGTALNYSGQNQNLIMNIHYPNFNDDPLDKRPIIVLMHGGSFLTGSLSNLDSVCIEFAKRGFVAVTIEYRLGWSVVQNCQNVTINTVMSANKAIYRSIQDLHASIRYLVENSEEYKIDTSWIFAGGVSAGAFATSDLAFVSQSQFWSRWPYCQSLGDIHTSGNILTNTFTLKGLFHNWGSTIDVDYINSSNAIPMIGFVGDMDIISPIDSGYFQNCTNFELMYGTRTIYNKLISLGICSELNVKIHGGHGVYNITPEQNIFRIGKASCFFKSLFCDECMSSYHTDSISSNCSINTDIKNNLPNNDIKIYPNPNNGHFTLETNIEKGNIDVFDLIGKLVHHTNNLETTYNLNLTEGIYILMINKTTKTKLIIKN